MSDVTCGAAAGSAALEKVALVAGRCGRGLNCAPVVGPFQPADGCVADVGGVALCGAFAACRLLALEAPSALDSESPAADESCEWADCVLAPAARALEAAFPGGEVQVVKPSPLRLDEFSLLYGLGGGGGGHSDAVVAAEAAARAGLEDLEARLARAPAAFTASLAGVLAGVDARRALPAFARGTFPGAERLADADRVAAASLVFTRESWDYDAAAESLYSFVSRLFVAAIAKAFPTATTPSTVMRCANSNFGDYQCNSPMSIHKELKEAGRLLPPKDVAAAIVAALPQNAVILACSVSPAGFINATVTEACISDFAANVVQSDSVAPPCLERAGGRKKVLVDFSSPNIAKEMHVGHLRSTIIGDTICKVFEFCGHEVLRVNHVGDWGTQFGMLISHMEEAYPNFLQEPPNITDLTEFYKAAKRRFDESEPFKTLARETVVQLQAGDAKCRAVWQVLCDISRAEFDKVYARLGVELYEFGESYYNGLIPAVLNELEAKKICALKDGAMCAFLPGHSFPLIVKKSDGGFGYDSTDMAAVHHRLITLKCDVVVYVTDIGQGEHFHMCFEAAALAGWTEAKVLKHVGFGLVQGIDGKRFKTRSGDTVRLVDLLDEAVVRMEASLEARVAEGKCPLAPDEVKAAAAAVGYGACKYFDLHQHPSTNYKFSYDKMLTTNGNTAVYLLFAHARLASIVRKGASDKGVDLRAAARDALTLPHARERALAFELAQFGDAIDAVTRDLSPVRLCDYLYKVANLFTGFITDCRIMDDPRERPRLVLCEATGIVMRKCFELLGITPLFKI
ncbi:tRNA synthetases class I (R)-domain-containing protein [Pelagophyceae sp. CCMP2097]|nr:tRNA synthetases class I (R)-domain-containing protein [Pelagophyceae sp. CCMP2097]